LKEKKEVNTEAPNKEEAKDHSVELRIVMLWRHSVSLVKKRPMF
jgi:hypothetical protein